MVSKIPKINVAMSIHLVSVLFNHSFSKRMYSEWRRNNPPKKHKNNTNVLHLVGFIINSFPFLYV